MKELEAVIFDIDGTLTPEISWTALTRDIGAPIDQHVSIYQDFRDEKITYEESKEKLLRLWRGTGKANRKFLTKLFEQWPIRDEAVGIINYLKSKGYAICLITGSLDLYAEIMARRLGVDFYFANTKLIWDEERNLIDFDYQPDQGKKKLKQFQEFCATNNLDPKKCLIVGDDENDIDLFIFTGKGVVVKSDTSHKLEEVAWKKIDSLLELEGMTIKWVAISGSWRKTNPQIEKDVRCVVKEIISRGDGIITGGALNVDFFATDEALKLDPAARQIKVCLPVTLELYAAHFKKRAREEIITYKEAENLIAQLTMLKQINPKALIENKINKVVNQNTYFERNSMIIELADDLVAFSVNESLCVQDTIAKARQKDAAVQVFRYHIP